MDKTKNPENVDVDHSKNISTKVNAHESLNSYLSQMDQSFEEDSTLISLGQSFLIHIRTPKLEESKRFYEILGFSSMPIDLNIDSSYVMYDGSMGILLEANEHPSMGLSYFSENLGQQIRSVLKGSVINLKNLTFSMDLKKDITHMQFNQDSTTINLYKASGHNLQYENVSVIWNDGDMSKIKFPNPAIGTFQEYAISVENIDTSVIYWEKLGFKSSGINKGTYPYAILYDGSVAIGLHQTNGAWHGNHMTYSTDGNRYQKTIEALRAAGFNHILPLEYNGSIIEGNYLVSDPDGHVINLFTDFRPE